MGHSNGGTVTHINQNMRPGGGPAGYLYNLKTGLKDNPDARIKFVATQYESDDRHAYALAASYKKKIARFMPPFVVPLMSLKRQARLWSQPLDISDESLKVVTESDVLVFHNGWQCQQYVNRVGRNHGQKIYVMHHGPTDLSTELAEERIMRWGYAGQWNRARAHWATFELKAFQLADGILAPCKGALEAHFEFDRLMKHVYDNIPVYELATGAPAMQVTRSKEEVLSALGIAAEKRVIGFFGRYHTHKGFDLFCETARLAEARGDRRFVFICAGSGQVDTPVGLSNFMDIGWQKEELPNYMNAADLILIPNRYTYFDLLMLEAMSLGKPLLTSTRGGNKCLRAHTMGVAQLEELSPDSIYQALRKYDDAQTLSEMSLANRNAYERFYDIKAFVKRHIGFADHVLSDESIALNEVARVSGLSSNGQRPAFSG